MVAKALQNIGVISIVGNMKLEKNMQVSPFFFSCFHALWLVGQDDTVCYNHIYNKMYLLYIIIIVKMKNWL